MLMTQLEQYLIMQNLPLKGNFHCLNPNHPHDAHPSMGYDAKHDRVHCFACNANWDIYDLVAVQQLNAPVDENDPHKTPQYDYLTAKQAAEHILGHKLGEKHKTLLKTSQDAPERFNDHKQGINHGTTKTPQKSLQSFLESANWLLCCDATEPTHDLDKPGQSATNKTTADILSARQAGRDYLASRGITLATASQYRLGYAPGWQSPTALAHGGNPTPTPRLIIPTGQNSYVARLTVGDGIKKMKEGRASFFNGSALAKNQTIYLVEGEFDALSILQAGQQAIALGSVAMINQFGRLLNYYRQQRPDHFYPTILVALDNDDAGKQATRQLTMLLQKNNVTSYVVQIARGCKDANEALTSNPKQFATDVNQTAEHPDDRVQRWMDYFKDGKDAQAIPTGFENLDKALEGGLYEGLYGLGAISSLGKTTFVLQMADYMAMNGQPVLYFALEMGWQEMTSKSISRWTAIHELNKYGNYKHNLAQTTRSIQRGNWSDQYNGPQYNGLMWSIKHYAQYADNIIYRDGAEHRPTAQDVSDMVDNFVGRTGKKPVVVVDYLQMLAPVNERATDKANVTTSANVLKKIATRHHIPVLMISSFNRSSYRDKASMESFKESGDIEYSADILIGLQPAGIEGDGFDINDYKVQDSRQVEAVILKNRNGRTGEVLSYNYTPAFNLFADTGSLNDQHGPELPDAGDDKTDVSIDEQGRVSGANGGYSADSLDPVDDDDLPF